MWTYNYTPSTDELYHHGILGQKWGVRNGPPYPLGSGKHSTAETKAGWQKSLDKSGSDGDNKRKLTRSSRLSGAAPTVVKSGSGNDKQKTDSKQHRFSLSNLTDDQKRLIKKGAIVAGSLLAAYGGKKLFDAYVSGNLVYEMDAVHRFLERNFGIEPPFVSLKRLAEPETLEQTLLNTDSVPALLNGGNCITCGITACLRQMGYDVTTRNVSNQQTISMLENFFKGIHDSDIRRTAGDAAEFTKSQESAKSMLLREFGNNAFGICGIRWKTFKSFGHCFNWQIKDGTVTFFDTQRSLFHKMTLPDVLSTVDKYWDDMDAEYLDLARLDDKELLGTSHWMSYFIKGRT